MKKEEIKFCHGYLIHILDNRAMTLSIEIGLICIIIFRSRLIYGRLYIENVAVTGVYLFYFQPQEVACIDETSVNA